MIEFNKAKKNKKTGNEGSKSRSSILSRLIISTKLLTVILLIFIVYRFFFNFNTPLVMTITQSSIVTILKETSLKLLTNTTVTMVHSKFEDLPSSLGNIVLLGSTEGFMIAKVNYSFGINLAKISEDSVRITDQSITITLPEPELLVCQVDTESIEIYSKTPLTRRITDILQGRNITLEMIKAFEQRAQEFAKENGLEPTKDEIIKNIEPFFNKLIAAQANKRVIFK